MQKNIWFNDDLIWYLDPFAPVELVYFYSTEKVKYKIL